MPTRQAVEVPPAAKIVARAPNWLGDTVMALPALAGMRASFPDSRVTVVGRWAPLLRGQGIADVLLEYPRRASERRRMDRALAADPADLAVILPGSFESALTAWRWGARRRLGFDTDARRPLLTDVIPRPAPRGHQVDEYLLLLEGLGAPPPLRTPAFRRLTDRAAESDVEALLASVGLPSGSEPVGLHLGAAGGSAKQWPADAVARLADALDKAGLTPLLLGSFEDAGRAARIVAASRSTPASLVGRDRPALLPHLLVRLSCLVSGDTGVAHLAAALGIPTVTLFGPTDPRLTAPRSERGELLIGPAPCAPCFLRTCPIEHVCLRAISVEDVERLILKVAGA